MASIFKEKVSKFDPDLQLTDVFFFDGASNVQKAGEILMAHFRRRRLFCFHGGEHVVSLFFSSIANIPPMFLPNIIKIYGSPLVVFQVLILRTMQDL